MSRSLAVSLLAVVPAASQVIGLDHGLWASLGSTLSLRAASTSGGPTLAPQWTAHVLQGYSSSQTGVFEGTYFYDGTNQRWRQTACATIDMFHPDDKMCVDSLAKNLSGSTGLNMNITNGQGDDAICKVFPTPYYDLFTSLAGSEHQGSSSIAGEPCEVWFLNITTPVFFQVSACIGTDGVPRQYNMSTKSPFKAAANASYTFSNVSVGAHSDDVFEPSDVCSNKWPMPPCQSNAPVALDLYRLRSSKEPNVLDDRNLGDALGDLAFFCELGGLDPTQVVTWWNVTAEASWGQYGYCLYQNGKNFCYGSTGKQVGRESAMGMGKGARQGQCSANEELGSWYSFTSEGKCADGTSVGDAGCTWVATQIRTVSAQCIVDRGIKQSCMEEQGHAPFVKSLAIFKAALSSSDPAKGGCPDVTTELLLVV